MTLFTDLSGRISDADEATIPVLDSAVTRGDGVFETILVTGGDPQDLPEHLQRLQQSAAALEIDMPGAEAWRGPLAALTEAWLARHAAEPDFSLRLTATRSGTRFATAAPIPPETIAARSGIAVILAPDPFRRSVPYLAATAKSLSYAMNMAALRYARARGADDVIFVGDDGVITESPTAAVVLESSEGFVTPPSGPGTGILDSITARRLAPRRAPVTAHDLLEADAVYLVSSVRLAAPVTVLDGVARSHDPARTARVLATLLGRPVSSRRAREVE